MITLVNKLRDVIEGVFIDSRNKWPQCFMIGNTSLHCCFAENIDASFFTDALLHLQESQPTGLPLHVSVIDYEHSGRAVPDWLWFWPSIDAYSGQMQGLPPQFYGNCNTNTNLFVLIDFEQGRAIVWYRNWKVLPSIERTFPFRQLLFFWFKNTPFSLVHGGAVGLKSGGVLLAGVGGSGKSTATLACLKGGVQYAGDDFVLVNTNTAHVHSLYNSAKLEAHNFERFPHLAPYIYNKATVGPEEKGHVYVHHFAEEKLIQQFPLRAIFLPKFTGKSKTAIKPATKADAMKALAPSSVWILRTEVSQVSKIATLVRTLPAYWIETGTDMDDIPLNIENFLHHV
jgi:hypothetical protein